jgi:hypothetical protein
MTPEQQRIAIAQACGWLQSRTCHWGGWWYLKNGKRTYQQTPPDYLNDLNACHEMEQVLTPKYQPAKGESQWSDYLGWLGFCGENKIREVYECVTATASQRSEAFLRTIGKWEESRWQDDAEDGGEARRNR